MAQIGIASGMQVDSEGLPVYNASFGVGQMLGSQPMEATRVSEPS